MCYARELLTAVVEYEEAGVKHAQNCPICAISLSKAACPEATNIAIASIETLLMAKVYLDETDHDNHLRSSMTG